MLRHDPRHPAPDRHRRCRPACSSTAATSPPTSAGPSRRPWCDVGDGSVHPLPPRRPGRRSSPRSGATTACSTRRHRTGSCSRCADVSKTFKQQRHDGAGAGRRRPRAGGGRDARPRRRIGVGQVDAGQDDARHPRPRRRRRGRARRPRGRRQHHQAHGRRPPRRADGLPEPRLGAQPQLDRAADPQAVGHQAHRVEGQGGRRAGRRSSPSRCGSRRATSTSSRASCPVASSSASRSPGPSPATRGSWSATSPPARSTCRCRRRS